MEVELEVVSGREERGEGERGRREEVCERKFGEFGLGVKIQTSFGDTRFFGTEVAEKRYSKNLVFPNEV